MEKVRIKLVSIGHLPMEFKASKVKAWKSSTFDIVGEIGSYSLRCDSDSEDWVFSDNLVREQLPDLREADFQIAIVSVQIEKNWYARRLGNNQIVFTFFEVKDILSRANIPLENVIYRILYAYTLLYRRSGNRIPNFGEVPGYTHDETRGCLFDMNGIKTDLVASCDRPIVCDECQERLRKEKVSNELIVETLREIKGIKIDSYYRMLHFIRRHPVWAFILSSTFALLVGTVTSLMASFLYEWLKK